MAARLHSLLDDGRLVAVELPQDQEGWLDRDFIRDWSNIEDTPEKRAGASDRAVLLEPRQLGSGEPE